MPKTTDRLAPDWGHWLNMATVSLYEAVYLSLNIDPRIEKAGGFRQSRGITRVDDIQLKKRGKPYEDRFKQAESAIVQRTLVSNYFNAPMPLDRSLIQVSLPNFVSWVAGLTNPWDLSNELVSLHAMGLKTEEDPRLIASFEKILLALAISHFNFDPFAKKNGAARDIHLETKKLGLEVSVSNIRKKIANASAEHIDETVKKKIELNQSIGPSSKSMSKTSKR